MIKTRKPYANYLKERREAAGFTQNELAEVLDLKFSTISRYESGTRGMDKGTIQKIASTLGCTPHEIFTPVED